MRWNHLGQFLSEYHQLAGVSILEAELGGLHPVHSSILGAAQQRSQAFTPEHFRQHLLSHGVPAEKHEKVFKRLHQAPITVNFPAEDVLPDEHPDAGMTGLEAMVKAGRHKPLHEMGVGTSTLPHRDKTETTMFGPHVTKLEPHQRPIYGAINAFNVQNGAASMYGDSHLEMHPHVRARSTITRKKNDPNGVFHGENAAGVVTNTGDGDSEIWHHLADAPDRPITDDEHDSMHGGRYVEAQIHGGIDYAKDVAGLHISQRSWEHPEHGPRTQKAAAEFNRQYGVPVYVQGRRVV